MSKEEILSIAEEILQPENIVAAHGTSISKAESIMNTGLRCNHTTYVIFGKNSTPQSLATYGWKENDLGDAANVIIEIPGSFHADLLGMQISEVQTWLSDVLSKFPEETIIQSISDSLEQKNDFFQFGYVIPKEFIRGRFEYLNNTNYLSFLTKSGIDYEAALENLSFVENPLFYDGLPLEAKEEFLKSMRIKMGISESPKR